MYQLTTGSMIIRTTDGACVPADPCNSDYQAYLTWIATGNTPIPVTQLTLQQAQSQQIALVNQQRDTLEQGGFSYLGKTIQSDPISAQRIMYAAFTAQQAINANQTSAYSLTWTCTDNSQLTMTAAQASAMATTLAEYGQTLFIHAQTIKLAINAATTVEAVQAITW